MQVHWKIKLKINQFLKQFKILDEDNTISLSNIIMMVVIVKLAMAPALDWGVITTLFLALVNHNARKFNHYKSNSKSDKSKEEVAALNKKVDDLGMIVKASRLVK